MAHHIWGLTDRVCVACGATLQEVISWKRDPDCPQKELDFGEADRNRTWPVGGATPATDAGPVKPSAA